MFKIYHNIVGINRIIEEFVIWRYDEITAIYQIFKIVIIDNRKNYFVKIKTRILQLSTSLSNLNVINNTHYRVYKLLSSPG